MANYLVIGASSGIGKATAERLKQEGHSVYVTYNQNEINYNADNIQQWDANSEEELIVPEVLDGLVYCPGTINLKPFHRIKAQDFINEMNINFIGAVKSIQAALPSLKKAEYPSIVLFSTVAVQNGMAFHAGIASAKGAIEGLTRSLASELAPKIRVNAIAPSITDTPLAGKLLSTEEKKEASGARHALKRVGTSEDMANSVLYLLKEESSWMTGQILHVDGGMSSTRPL